MIGTNWQPGHVGVALESAIEHFGRTLGLTFSDVLIPEDVPLTYADGSRVAIAGLRVVLSV